MIANVLDIILAPHRNPSESCKESCKYVIVEINKLYSNKMKYTNEIYDEIYNEIYNKIYKLYTLISIVKKLY